MPSPQTEYRWFSPKPSTKKKFCLLSLPLVLPDQQWEPEEGRLFNGFVLGGLGLMVLNFQRVSKCPLRSDCCWSQLLTEMHFGSNGHVCSLSSQLATTQLASYPTALFSHLPFRVAAASLLPAPELPTAFTVPEMQSAAVVVFRRPDFIFLVLS